VGKQETLRQVVSRLRQRGFSLQEVADLLGVAIAEVEAFWHK
jgi:predicted transcriptional regulator